MFLWAACVKTLSSCSNSPILLGALNALNSSSVPLAIQTYFHLPTSIGFSLSNICFMQFPIEVREVIFSYLPAFRDKIQYLLANKENYCYLYHKLFTAILIYNRGQVRKLFKILALHSHLGSHVRSVELKNRVGLTHQEFQFLGKTCPNIEVLEFSSWRSFIPHSILPYFPKIRKLPAMTDDPKSLQVLAIAKHKLTHLSYTTAPTHGFLLRTLSTATNLTHLVLTGKHRSPGQRLLFDLKRWDTLHAVCQRLVHLEIHHLISEEVDAEPKKFTHPPCQEMKTLVIIEWTIKSPIYLSYLAAKYPFLEHLEINFDWDTFLAYDPTSPPRLDFADTQAAFMDLASSHLQIIRLSSLMRSHFPGKRFFDKLVSAQLREVIINYCSRKPHSPDRLDTETFQAIVLGQTQSLEVLSIGLWAKSTVQELSASFSLTIHLSSLTLSNGFDKAFQIQEIPLDLLLSGCSRLKRLVLNRTTLVIGSAEVQGRHPLETLLLKHSRVSREVFCHLSDRCRRLNHLELASCFWDTQGLGSSIELPHNTLSHVEILDFNRFQTTGVDSQLSSGALVRLFAIVQLDKDLRPSWYHLYANDVAHSPPSILRRFKKPHELLMLRSAIDICQEHELRRPRFLHRNCYSSKKSWFSDVSEGYLQFVCRSVRKLKLNHNEVLFETS